MNKTTKQNNKESIKSYTFEITLKFTQLLEASNNIEAINQLKETFMNEYNIELADTEIKVISKESNE